MKIPKHLCRLEFDQCGITDKGIASLKGISLTDLTLRQCDLSNAALITLGEIGTLKNLTIENCPVSEEAIESLRRTLPSCRISYTPKR